MKVNIEALECDSFYHIYNRGINGETVFKTESNYDFFLEKYAYHISLYIDTYAYCLLKNHFHFLVRIKSENDILNNIEMRYPGKVVSSIPKWMSSQFAHLFNGYAQAINKQENRSGGLFESPFRRIEVKNEAYLSRLISYIHQNPEKHQFVNDFRDYPHSSYHSHISEKPSKLKRVEVLNWFGGKNMFIEFHQLQRFQDKKINEITLEFD